MSFNTIEHNRRMNEFDHCHNLWLFGYGSLIYKDDFPYLEKQPASIRHWSRRFWQGSHDHRGTPDAPGRVVTLVEEPDALCKGVAYRITPQEFEYLDHREKNGYLRLSMEMTFDDGSRDQGLVYIARPDNAAYLGPASEREIAHHIARASGPSGHNRDYLLKLADALRELRDNDPHVFAVEKHLLSLEITS